MFMFNFKKFFGCGEVVSNDVVVDDLNDKPLLKLKLAKESMPEMRAEVKSAYVTLGSCLRDSHAEFAYKLDSIIAMDDNLRSNGKNGFFTKEQKDYFLVTGEKYLSLCNEIANELMKQHDDAVREYIKQQAGL